MFSSRFFSKELNEVENKLCSIFSHTACFLAKTFFTIVFFKGEHFHKKEEGQKKFIHTWCVNVRGVGVNQWELFTPTLTHTLSFSNTLSLTHTIYLSHTLSLSLTHTQNLSHSHTHACVRYKNQWLVVTTRQDGLGREVFFHMPALLISIDRLEPKKVFPGCFTFTFTHTHKHTQMNTHTHTHTTRTHIFPHKHTTRTHIFPHKWFFSSFRPHVKSVI